MKEKLKKAKGYVKEHKKEILIGTGVAILGCIGLSKVVKTVKPKREIHISTFMTPKSINATGVIGNVNKAYKYDNGAHELWIDELSLDKLGELGESIKNSIPGIPEDDKVWLLMGVYSNDK